MNWVNSDHVTKS